MTERSPSNDEAFMAAVSHELRGPLHAFLGLSELLLNSELDDENRRIAQTLYDEAASMRVLVDDVITYGEFSSTTPTLEHESFAPRTLVTSIADRLRPEAKESGLRLLVDFASEVPLRVMGDSVRFGQVVHNLISNAVRYTQIGSVQVTLASDTSNLSVQVRDSGVGIASSDLETIFDPFVRVGTSGVKGTGLGLAIVRRIADAMDGTISVDSTVGVGTTFVFSVPCSLAETQEVERVAASGTASGTVLVVEDSEINRTLALKQLELLGLGAIAVETGERALAFLETETEGVDLVLMDWNLPGANGIETTQSIRTRELIPEDVPIIAMTANVLAGDRLACLEAGMNDHLGKPVSLDDMRTMMTRWLGVEDDVVVGPDERSVAEENMDDVIDALVEDLGDADTVRVVIETYHAELGSRTDQLIGRSGDVSDEARRAAHTLKSTSALVGAHRLALLCEEFEATDDPSKELRARLIEEITHVETHLQQRLETGIAA